MPIRRSGVPSRTLALLSSVLAGFLVAGCGSSHAASRPAFPTGSATAGDLHISDAYVPLNASPSVAAAYFTVTDDGGADTLVSVSSPVSRDVGLHRTVDSGTTGEMVSVASLPVSRSSALRLQPGGAHVMLMQPSVLRVGQRVLLTLHFAKAGAIAVQTPVVPLTSSNDDSAAMGMS